ncbi:MAG: hypothetical protein U0836_08275 [Pirellulales bacterium]
MSRIRLLLGDQAVEQILILRDIANVDPADASRLFPEAKVSAQ